MNFLSIFLSFAKVRLVRTLAPRLGKRQDKLRDYVLFGTSATATVWTLLMISLQKFLVFVFALITWAPAVSRGDGTAVDGSGGKGPQQGAYIASEED